jgi:hypothetical protein
VCGHDVSITVTNRTEALVRGYQRGRASRLAAAHAVANEITFYDKLRLAGTSQRLRRTLMVWQRAARRLAVSLRTGDQSRVATAYKLYSYQLDGMLAYCGDYL